MESNTFDNLVRGAFAQASRRGALRIGAGALAASAMATLGLTAADTAAKKKKKKKKKKPPVETCPADRPLTCGNGCCPSNYPKCCDDAREAANSHTCAPASFNCCPIEQGGGSCDGDRPVCCNATLQRPFGSCTATGGVCCPTEQGGGECPPDLPVCCLNDPADLLDGGYCCPAGLTCCQEDADCASNNCDVGCCLEAPREGASRRSERTQQGVGGRFHMKAA